jgi:hypothetical protein
MKEWKLLKVREKKQVSEGEEGGRRWKRWSVPMKRSGVWE